MIMEMFPIYFVLRQSSQKAVEHMTNFKRILKIKIVLKWPNIIRNRSIIPSLILVVTWEFLRYWYGSAGNS